MPCGSMLHGEQLFSSCAKRRSISAPWSAFSGCAGASASASSCARSASCISWKPTSPASSTWRRRSACCRRARRCCSPASWSCCCCSTSRRMPPRVRQPIYGLLLGNALTVGLVLLLRFHDVAALPERAGARHRLHRRHGLADGVGHDAALSRCHPHHPALREARPQLRQGAVRRASWWRSRAS